MGSMMGILGINFAVLVATITLLWLYACKIRDASFIDAFWGFGMVILAATSWLQMGMPGGRSALIFALVAAWGLRLAIHLYTRWRAEGEDRRYKSILGRAMEKNGWSWPIAALIMVFIMQAPLLFITSLPAQMGIAGASGDAPAIGLLAIIGAVAAIVGILFESIGDAQLKAFKANPENDGQVMDRGLWRYTRHPNYFGDFLAWWGIWLVAADVSFMIAAISVIGPVFLSFTLMKWSGAPMLERGMKKRKPKYADYIARTSAFFPWPPKNT